MAESIIELYKIDVIHARGPLALAGCGGILDIGMRGFNNRRLLEPIGRMPPAEFEREYCRLNTTQTFAA
jgi:putative transposase